MSNETFNHDVIALTLLAAAECAHSYSSYLPSVFTIKTLALDGKTDEVDQKLANLRAGYKPAITFGLAIGGLVSFLAKSPLPLMASAGTAVLMMKQYESALPQNLQLGISDLLSVVTSGQTADTALALLEA